MTDPTRHLSRSAELSAKVGQLLHKRLAVAQEKFTESTRHAMGTAATAGGSGAPATPWDALAGAADYATDFAQRSILFWDALRERGNNFVEHTRAGMPPVLHFQYEMELDGRGLPQPVNYALVRIVPPHGVQVDNRLRPYVIIDPRAGHGPGIGGFKDDSQVGVALQAGHPVYFVIFFPDPEPGQTMLDVCNAEKLFVQRVRELHPTAPKPAIVGNCQGGWAAMMLASGNPDDTGPVVINGAPMSYWGGAWEEGEGDNPMRYAGGLLGGTWLASLTSDLGGGTFDGAWLVQNFENLNLANTYWDKYYHLLANADTEPPRFLEFERWWGGFYLMNREEIEWITRNLFVGNKLWKGSGPGGAGLFDLRAMKVPIVLFASMGDNITPPEQAFNWVADVYGSTEEIKARGQVIVGLLHQDIGHLGIFVSGKVAKKEHAQIVEVMESIEALPPGLYGMHISERKGTDGAPVYEVRFEERRLEDLTPRLNRFQRADEKPFEAVAAISDFNQRAYELFARPLVQSMSTELGGKLSRTLHPLRMQRWALSDLNPATWWIKPAAEMVRQQRKPLPTTHPGRQAEKRMADLTSATLEYVRGVRDALSEAQFFSLYGNLFSIYLADGAEAPGERADAVQDPRQLPVVKEALASIDHGGYAEATARAAYLLARKGEPLPLERLELRKELLTDYKHLLAKMPLDEARRVRGEQELIVRFEPDRAIATLPQLLPERSDRERFLSLLDRLLADQRVQKVKPLPEQVAMLERIRTTVGGNASAARRRPAGRRQPSRAAR